MSSPASSSVASSSSGLAAMDVVDDLLSTSPSSASEASSDASGGGRGAQLGLRRHQTSLDRLPCEVLCKIMGYCGERDVSALAEASAELALVVDIFREGKEEDVAGRPTKCNVGPFAQMRESPQLDLLPSEVLLHIFKLLDRQSLGRTAQVNTSKKIILLRAAQKTCCPVIVSSPIFKSPETPRATCVNCLVTVAWFYSLRALLYFVNFPQVCSRFRELAYAECLWLTPARDCLATNSRDASFVARSAAPLSSRDAVRVSGNWRRAQYEETKLLVQNTRFMPRLQLERDLLWVSWGNRIWAHPRNPEDGTIARATTRALKGHTDDVSRFVVKDGLLVSGGRDATLLGWNSDTGEFLFAKRYCHGGEVSAVDADAPHSGVVVTGSRDRTVKIWSLSADRDCVNNNSGSSSVPFPELASTVDLGDRVWSLACDPFCGGGRVAVGSAGLGGVPALHLMDLSRPLEPAALGETVLKKGAGVLDLQWHGRDTFLSCGYDTFARLWDVRCAGDSACVRSWEEPFDESVYCLATDGHVTMVTGTARHGLARLWDFRQSSQPVAMYYARHAHHGQSSPVYSVAFDQSNLYLALDQCLNLLSFDDQAGWDMSQANSTYGCITPTAAEEQQHQCHEIYSHHCYHPRNYNQQNWRRQQQQQLQDLQQYQPSSHYHQHGNYKRRHGRRSRRV